LKDWEQAQNAREITNEQTYKNAESRIESIEAQAGDAAEIGDAASISKAINEIDSFLKEVSGEPAKFDKTPAGLQGNMFQIQAQQPKKAISSNIPLSKQVEGTMFEPQKPKNPDLFK
jgi:hypothetical protein